MSASEESTYDCRREHLGLIEFLQREVLALRRENADLREQNADLRAQNAALREQVSELLKRVAELERSSGGKKKGASHQRKQERRKPGRKPGQGPFTRRTAPDPSEYSTPPIDVPLDRDHCECGGALIDAGSEIVTNTDLPPCPKPIITPYRIQRKRCSQCGTTVRGCHPEVASDQLGATAHRIGMRAYATGLDLHYEHGVPLRRVPRILEVMTGLRITQSALTQAALKAAERGAIGKGYELLRKRVKRARRVYTDDTGWSVDGVKQHLMGFDSDRQVVFQVRPRHRNEEVRELVPSNYKGTMATDRGSSYDAKEFENVKQHKCHAHIERDLNEVLEKKTGRARWFTRRLKDLLHMGRKLLREFKTGSCSKPEYLERGAAIEQDLTKHLRDRTLSDPDNQRLLNELGRHHDRGNLVRFLKDPGIEPTTNRIERALRGPVIARKVSQGSKNARGVRALEAFRSIIPTLKKRGLEVIETLARLLRGEALEAILRPG